MPPADIAADPNTITDPLGGPAGSGGAANFNILDVFQEFGYQPTQAEISALSSSFGGSIDPYQIGSSAVGQYVNFMDQIKQTEANDPLAALQTSLATDIAQNRASIEGLYGQIQSTLTSAPQLFGDLTPDQISTYIQPLQTAFTQQLSQVQGAMASRGVAGSSTENNALAQTNLQFQQGLLSTGLSIGQQQQQARAQAMQAQINNLFGLTGQETGIKGQAAGQESAQNLSESNLLASLPSFYNSQAQMQEAIAQANKANTGFQSEFNTVTGDIGSATGALTNLFNVGKTAASAAGAGGPAGSPSTAAPATFNPSGIPSSNYTSPNLNVPGYNQFAATGSLFGS